MEIPQIPTDKSYKFLAIFGLISLIVIWSYLFFEINKLSLDSIEFKKSTEMVEVEVAFYERNPEEFSKEKSLEIIKNVVLYKNNGFIILERSYRLLVYAFFVFLISLVAKKYMILGFVTWWNIDRKKLYKTKKPPR